MKLWLIEQSKSKHYNRYTGAVVAAETEEDARLTHPGSSGVWDGNAWYTVGCFSKHLVDPTEWTDPEYVTVKLLGETNQESGVILASTIGAEDDFNALAT